MPDKSVMNQIMLNFEVNRQLATIWSSLVSPGKLMTPSQARQLSVVVHFFQIIFLFINMA